MKKLNRKGYLTIEIVIASVITFVIAFFLIDLTMKLVDITDNAYADTLLITDKTLIINNIRKELENDMNINGNIKIVVCEEDAKTCTITFNNETKRYLSVNNNILTYKDKIDDETANIIYSKKIHNSLSDISISSTTDYGYYNFKISGENIFIDEDYEMNINVYNESVPTLAASSTWYRGETPRSEITKIKFVDSYTKTGDEIEEWSSAANVNGTGFNDEITCYIKNEGTDKVLIIAGNGTGKIYANENSRLLFSGPGGEDDFDRFINLITIENISVLDTSMVTTMYGVFADCKNLTTLDLSSWDTYSVTNMYGMFSKCEKLSSLDLNNFDTSNVMDMNYMFQGCNNLVNIELNEWNTSSVKSMIGMFYRCSSLTNLNVSNFKTSNVIDMSYMFRECSSLTELDVSKFDTSNVINMRSMFNECSSLENLNVSNFKTSNVTDMAYMFVNCSSLTELDVSKFDTSNVINMRSMFNECSSLTELDVSSFKTSNVEDMGWMFAHLNVESLNLTNFNTSNVKNMAAMFHHCYRLASIDLTSFDMSNVEIVNELNETGTNKVGMFSDSNNLTTIYVSNSPELSKVSDSTNMFKGSFLLKGGAGTRYDSNHLDATYARIDDPDNGNPGYFTYKEPTT